MAARKAPAPTEAMEQQALITWWRWWCKTKGLDERLLFAIPNGAVLAGDARKRAIQMNNLKKTGLQAGLPDLMLAIEKSINDDAKGIPYPEKVAFMNPIVLFHGMFIELKRIGGKLSPVQLEMCDLLRRSGYNVIVAQGADEAIRAIKAYLE